MRYQMTGLEGSEIRALERMPSEMQRFLALEARENTNFVTDYLIKILRNKDPYGQIVEDSAREYAACVMGVLRPGAEYYEWDDGVDEKKTLKVIFKNIAGIPKKIRIAVELRLGRSRP